MSVDLYGPWKTNDYSPTKTKETFTKDDFTWDPKLRFTNARTGKRYLVVERKHKNEARENGVDRLVSRRNRRLPGLSTEAQMLPKNESR